MKISQLTDYDKEVHRAIRILYFTGNKFITESVVFSAMNWFRDLLTQWENYFNELEKVILYNKTCQLLLYNIIRSP